MYLYACIHINIAVCFNHIETYLKTSVHGWTHMSAHMSLQYVLVYI